MVKANLIALNEFCRICKIEPSFVNSLQEYGLIEIIHLKEIPFIEIGQLHQLEKLIRFYYELDINLEGIETIAHLLARMNRMQEEIAVLRNRLRLFEESSK
jgi:chaperone modulatory protein CbpM